MLERVSIEAIGRIVDLHDFRHLKSTRLVLDENLSDDSKCKLMGWSSRRMLDRYAHITVDDAKTELLQKKENITLDENKKNVESAILKPKECLVYHNINGSTDDLCEKCGNSLNYEQMIKDFTNREEVEGKMNTFFKPEQMQQLFKTMYKLQKQMAELKENKQSK